MSPLGQEQTQGRLPVIRDKQAAHFHGPGCIMSKKLKQKARVRPSCIREEEQSSLMHGNPA